LTRVWFSIAKAEMLVRTSRMHPHRKMLYPMILLMGILWAFVGAPRLLSLFLGEYGYAFEVLVATSIHSVMRAVILLLFLFVLVVPLANSLENVKTDQWEIIFSSNVSTRDLLLGTYLGKIPVYGLFVIFLAPVMVTPFAWTYGVTVLGQALMYTIIFVFALATIFLSNILSTAVHAKIGESPRGDDIGKALSWALIPLVAIPSIGMFYWTGSIVSALGLGAVLILPTTWCADLLTLTAAYNSNLPPSSIANIQNYLIGVPPTLELALFAVFILGLFVVGLRSADRLFAYGAGPMTKRIARAGRDNLFIKGMKRIFGEQFGVVMASAMKDYTRKLQNVAKLSYGVFLALLVPFMFAFGPFSAQIPDPLFVPIMTSLTIGMMLGMFSGVIFGGIGFLDSKDQMWILKSAPNGVNRYVLARTLCYLLLCIPYALIPSLSAGLLIGLSWQNTLLVIAYVYCVVAGGVFVGIGITAANPAYEDTSSGAFTVNTLASILTMMVTMMFGLVQGVLIGIKQGVFAQAIVSASIAPPLVGLIILIFGTYRLNISEVA
jgi:hypothetical protein